MAKALYLAKVHVRGKERYVRLTSAEYNAGRKRSKKYVREQTKKYAPKRRK